MAKTWAELVLDHPQKDGCWGCGASWESLRYEPVCYAPEQSAYFCERCDVYTTRATMPTTDRGTREAIRVVLEQVPELTRFGFDVYHTYKKDPTTHQEKFAQDREALLNDGESFEQVCAFLAHVSQQKTFYRYSSYGWKHLAENWIGDYVANGTFIAAAICCGFRWQRCDQNSPNAYFNMTKGSRNRLSKEIEDKHRHRVARDPAQMISITKTATTTTIAWPDPVPPSSLERTPMGIQLYKDGAALAIQTDCPTEEVFMEQFCKLFSNLIGEQAYAGEWEFHLRHWLPQFIELCNAYRGYKNRVTTKTVYTAGDLSPGEPVHRFHDLDGVFTQNGHRLESVDAPDRL